ncbi:hypothetical protein Tco_1482623 [Tanacetum coccineum]
MLRPLAPLLELIRFGILLGEREEGQITSSGWPFVSAVLGQMAHLVASITLNSARSYLMIIVAVVGVGVMVVVVESSSVIKLSFMIT